mmetsp:Transcript_36684/g.72129  ORF Transcript_36684/g.72129 Transcript_36684/m.72129 type:complete len:242 (-) Transcript_36684:376-1101(-)
MLLFSSCWLCGRPWQNYFERHIPETRPYALGLPAGRKGIIGSPELLHHWRIHGLHRLHSFKEVPRRLFDLGLYPWTERGRPPGGQHPEPVHAPVARKQLLPLFDLFRRHGGQHRARAEGHVHAVFRGCGAGVVRQHPVLVVRRHRRSVVDVVAHPPRRHRAAGIGVEEHGRGRQCGGRRPCGERLTSEEGLIRAVQVGRAGARVRPEVRRVRGGRRDEDLRAPEVHAEGVHGIESDDGPRL